MALLDAAEVRRALDRLPGWRQEGAALVRDFSFPSFPDAVAAVVRLAFEAEAADHHPDITITYRRVRLAYSTHSAGGITQKDVDGAALADRVFAPAAQP